MSKYVYIASPYTLGDVGVNVRNSISAADRLMSAGLFPYSPLLNHFQHLVHPRSYQDWLDLDLRWLAKCDAVVRLPGESKGADIEVAKAAELGIPVFYNMGRLMAWAFEGGPV